LLSLVAASLLLQGLFPAGYMPGNLASGWVAVLCPEGLPAAFVQQLNARVEARGGQAHHHHGDHGNHGEQAAAESSEGWCQLGSALDQPFAIGQAQLQSTGLQLILSSPLPPVLRTPIGVLLAPQSRGPPTA